MRIGGLWGHGVGEDLAAMSLHGGAGGSVEGAEETSMLVIKCSGTQKKSKSPANGTH